jgi:hypothetical protein
VAKTTYLENAIINLVCNNTAYTPPITTYVALYTATPGPSGGGTEVSGDTYVRQAATFSTSTIGSTSNSVDITFPQAGASWGTISYFGLFDAVSSGNLLYYGSLTASKTIASGDQVKFSTGGLSLTES